MEELELHANIQGLVQGIGFRATVLNHAKSHKVLGEIKNLSDGSVEIIAQGTKKQLEDFLSSIQRNPGKAQISHVKSEFRNKNRQFFNFDITY